MKPPRNEREFSASVQPEQRVGIKFAGAMRPAPPRRAKRLTLWQRVLKVFAVDIRWIP